MWDGEFRPDCRGGENHTLRGHGRGTFNLFLNPVCLTMRLWVQDKQLNNFSQKEERGMGFPLSLF